MALRTFHSNPSLGGFGGESSARNHVNGDAFAQIIKELVDNAVDACSSATAAGTATTTKQTATSRVRVTIEPLTSISNNSNNNHNNSGDKNKKEGDSIQQSLIGQQLLRISVIDNGIGMENVQKCVDAFQTSKGADSTDPSHTAGRYGIGLTLTLLHAQRLVPNSAAIIQSATAQQDSWTKITCIVDTEGDSVRCIKQELFPKSYPLESGTSVCVLVPVRMLDLFQEIYRTALTVSKFYSSSSCMQGGTYANDVWPRVAEYFGRFKLSVGLCCSLEVLAPTLSKVPLFVRSPAAAASQSAYADHQSQESLNVESDNRALFQGLQDTNESETQNSVATIVATRSSIANDNSEDRVSIWKAAQSYLERPLLLKNVSHSMVPIRFDLKNPNPQLEVNLIVHGLNESSTETASDNDSEMSTRSTSLDNNDTTSDGGTMLLVRLVNKIPLLDCAEAVACGLVQGIAAKKKTWNSFGLDVSLLPNISDSTKRQMYCVRDSEQVAPFFKKGGHELFTASDDESSTDESADESTGIPLGQKRKRPQQRSGLLPAKLRLANILAIVQMHAKPTTLPLPTLSKVNTRSKRKWLRTVD
jgi:hypothetical protein